MRKVEPSSAFAAIAATKKPRYGRCGVCYTRQFFVQLVLCVTTKLRDKLHKRLPSVTPLGNVCLNFPVQVTKNLFDMGCYEVSLGDTIEVGAPGKKYFLNNQNLRFVP